MSNIDTEEKTFLNKVVMFYFFALKSIHVQKVKLTILTMSLIPFWTLNVVVAVYAGSESSRISSNIS